MKKDLNIHSIYDVLKSTNYNHPDSAIMIQRFLDKLGDSSKFANYVNAELNQIKLDERNDYTEKIKTESDFSFGFDYTNLKFVWNGSSYNLYKDDLLYLDYIDKRLAKKIVKDFNVAVLIKCSRLKNQES